MVIEGRLDPALLYDLFRALGGRKTVAEIAALDWCGDAEAIIGLLSRYPPPVQSLGE